MKEYKRVFVSYCGAMGCYFTRRTLSGARLKARRPSYGLTFGICLFIWAFLAVRPSYCYATSANPEKWADTPQYALSPDFERLADAIYRAEGGRKASRPYGIFFKGCDWAHQAYCRQICLNTIRNNFRRWKAESGSNSVLSGKNPLFLEFLANRYCPPSVDPVGNINWKKNVSYFYGRATS